MTTPCRPDAEGRTRRRRAPAAAILAGAALLLLAACAGPAGSAEGPATAEGTTIDAPATEIPAGESAESGAPAAAVPAPEPGTVHIRHRGPRRLHPGDDFERHLGAAEHHLYRLEVPAGRLAVVSFEQLGSDVLVQPRDPAGRALVPVDSPTGGVGAEVVYLHGEPGGTFDLLVRGWSAQDAGPYRVKVEPPISPGPRQHRTMEAERLLAEAYAEQDVERAVRAADLFAALDRPEREAMARFEVGRLLLDRGGNTAAVPHLERTVELFRRLGKDYWTGNSLTNLGLALQRTGHRAESERALLEAIPYHQRSRSWDDWANALDHLGRLAAASGASNRAFAYYEESLEKLGRMPADARGVAAAKARLERRIGSEYLSLDHVAQARLHAERALALVGAEGDASRDALMSRHLLCRVLEAEDDLEAAARCYAAVARGDREIGERREEAVVLVGLGRVLRDLGRLDAARPALERARATFEEQGETQPLGSVLNGLGRLELEARRPRRALEHFLQSIERSGDRRGAAISWEGVARARRALGDSRGALEAVERSIALAEDLRLAAVGPSLQAHFFATRQDSYELAVDLMMEFHAADPGAGWDARAFEQSERNRARALLDLLETVGAERPDPPSLAERDLLDELETLENLRADLSQDGASDEVLAGMDRNLEHLQVRLQRLSAGRRVLQGTAGAGGRPLDLAAIQRRVVDADTRLLAYHLGEERSYLWIVSPEALETVVLPPRSALEELASRAYELTRQSYRRTARVAAEAALLRLADALVAPVAGRLAGQRLLVRAEGGLLYVPWAALPLPGGRRLVEEHEIVVLPSSSVVAALRERAARRGPAPATLAVLADPVFDERDPRLTGGDGPVASRRSAAERFDRLPHSSREARALLRLAGGGTLLEGFEATRQAVLSGRLANHGYVHFATHAQIHPRRPALSSLVLSGVDRTGEARPGLLRAREVYDLDLAADLVVLSACRTALGEELEGEGLMGLTQGFFAAGAQRVLASLWDVDDHATAELMERFYRGLLEEELPAAAALREAQLALAREPRWQAPYFWAPFVLQGQPD